MYRRHSLQLLLTLLVVATLGCGSGGAGSGPEGAKVIPGGIYWSPTRAAENPPGEAFFRQSAEAMIGRLPPFPQEGAAAKVMVKGIFDEVDGTKTVILEAVLKGVKGGIPVEAGVVFRGEAPDLKASQSLTVKALEELEKTLSSQFSLWGGDAEQRIRALQSPEPDEQILAVRLLARDKVEQALTPMADLLSDPREQVAEAAAEAIGSMGNEGAVPLLIKSIEPRDLRSEVRAIEAMARIGGKEAEAYLEMTAQGHEVREVREISKAALERVRKGR